jgi:hypothetical protein
MQAFLVLNFDMSSRLIAIECNFPYPFEWVGSVETAGFSSAINQGLSARWSLLNPGDGRRRSERVRDVTCNSGAAVPRVLAEWGLGCRPVSALSPRPVGAGAGG